MDEVCGNPKHSRFQTPFCITKGKGIPSTWGRQERHRRPRENVVNKRRKDREGGGEEKRNRRGQTQGDRDMPTKKTPSRPLAGWVLG